MAKTSSTAEGSFLNGFSRLHEKLAPTPGELAPTEVLKNCPLGFKSGTYIIMHESSVIIFTYFAWRDSISRLSLASGADTTRARVAKCVCEKVHFM
jgi:hypothetical protein